ncbi:MAG: hypothetical protein R2844_02920 [Caldilineales bacterium]
MTAVPASRLLRLLNVQHVITDKGFDVWRDGVYYDLELSTRIAPGEAITLTATDRLEATALGVFSHLEDGATVPEGTVVGTVNVVDDAGVASQFELRAGEETADGRWTVGAPRPAGRSTALAARRGGLGLSGAPAAGTAGHAVQHHRAQHRRDRSRAARRDADR